MSRPAVLPSPVRKTIDLDGRIVKDGVRIALRDRQVGSDRTGSHNPRIPDPQKKVLNHGKTHESKEIRSASISHASEDTVPFVTDLAQQLRRFGATDSVRQVGPVLGQSVREHRLRH